FGDLPVTGSEGEQRAMGLAPAPEAPPALPPPAGKMLTLEDCTALALQNNPELLASGLEVEAAQAETRIKGAGRWPSVHLTGSYFHHQDDQRLSAPASPGKAIYYTDDILSADVIMRMPLYAGGRIVNEFRAAELLAKAAGHTLARTREELVFNVASTYYGILAQKHVVQSLEFSHKTLAEHLDRVGQLIEAQKAARVDALRTEVRLADVEQQLLQEKNVLEIAHRLLANLLGLEAGHASGLALSDTLTFLEPAPTVDDEVNRAFQQRSDYAAALAALGAQAKRVDVARGVREPEVSLEASYGGRWGIGGSGEPATQPSSSSTLTAGGQTTGTWSTTTPLPGGASITTTAGSTGAISARLSQVEVEPADDFEDVGRIGITMGIPIFEGGRIHAQIAKERALLHAARQRLRKLELQIQLEVETAVLNVNSARERVSVTQKSIAEAEESLRIERAKYNYGKGAIVDVLDAQSALLGVQTSYYRALADFNIATAQVHLATGGNKP
ncbi:MAG: TolC family protein, partial [Candidatus Hydrogenedentes bacterium]|nr:TolC family protein [Candidatus Hydrogenedentota bacterium]